MNLHPGDIYVKNDRGKKSAWISENAIVNNCDITETDYFRRAARPRYNKTVPLSFLKEFNSGTRQLLPDTGTGWRYGRVLGQYYYCFDNIPPRYRSQLGSREQILAMAEGFSITLANDVRETFSRYLCEHYIEYINQTDAYYYMYESGYNIPAATANDIAGARAWMEMIIHFEDTRKYQEHGIRFEHDFFDIAANTIPKVMGNALKTPDSLRKKAYYYRNSPDRRNFMISGKLGNDNRRVIGIYPVTSMETGEIFNFDVHEALIYELWMNPGGPGKLLKKDVYEEYAEQVEQLGYSPVKPRTVSFYLNRFSTRSIMSLERDGKEHFNDKYKPYIVQHKLNHTLTMWAADFSGSKIYYKTYKEKWINGKKQRSNVLTAQSWYMFRVVDVASGCVIGWSVCKSGEDWEQIGAGLKQAVDKSGGYAACEFVTDNSPAFTKAENRLKLAMLFKKHRRIAVGNKQSNPAEPYVHFLAQKARYLDNWMRSSFNSTHIDNQANPDYLNINNLPDENQALEQIAQLVEDWNNTARANGIIPDEFYSNAGNRNSQAIKVDARVHRYVFGNETSSRLSRSRGVLAVSRGTGQIRDEFKFTIPNWETTIELIDDALHGSANLDVMVKWDESGADLYTPEGGYILTALPTVPAHKSEFEATGDTYQALEDQIVAKQRFEKRANEFKEQVIEAGNVLKEEIVQDDLTYTQRAALNQGKAKEDHNIIMQAVYEINKKARPINEDEPFIDDVLNDF